MQQVSRLTFARHPHLQADELSAGTLPWDLGTHLSSVRHLQLGNNAIGGKLQAGELAYDFLSRLNSHQRGIKLWRQPAAWPVVRCSISGPRAAHYHVELTGLRCVMQHGTNLGGAACRA